MNFICSLPTGMPITVDKQLVFTSENISAQALRFKWAAQATEEKEDDEVRTQLNKATQPSGESPNLSSESELERNTTRFNQEVIGGFSLKWQLQGTKRGHEIFKGECESTWDLKKEKDLNMLTILNLVRESKSKGLQNEKVWKALLKSRWNSEVLNVSPCLTKGQAAEVIFKTGQDLGIMYDWNIRVYQEDVEFAKELYSSVLFCPDHLVEAAKLSTLFETLLADQNLRTIVASTMQNIQPRASDNIKDFTAINMWYKRLDERYNFSLGPTILPLLTTENLTQLAALDPPYLKNYNTSVQERADDNMSFLFGKYQL